MPHYLVQASYTSETLALLSKNPQNRLEIVAGVVQKLGGRVEAGYFSFGDYDVTMIVELPDNSTAAGMAIGSAGKGHVKAIKTTPLLTGEEALEAMRVAGGVDLQLPG